MEMEEVNMVKLHGVGADPYSKRVEMALRIKGIPYEYIEEDMNNKSQSLLNYNPIYKKIPNPPRLLPHHPFERAKVHFWANFIQQELFEAMTRVFVSDGEVQAKAVDEMYGKTKVLEEGMMGFFKETASPPLASVGTENLGLLDILICSIFSTYEAYEEAIGVKVLDTEKSPMVFGWVNAMKELPLVKGLYPPHHELVAMLKAARENRLKASSST
ncbi:putative Glutathione S-transferase tau 9 [Hibiscus syriacus]|uniref:Glutathione S-transferase n=1 Tax=Hibiscus syriacus TaxID=106335 RepID=A0A6A3DAI2_HIBSY|nr:putative Glutathione S-transferase tau 9 [Hibiscus syriacus]